MIMFMMIIIMIINIDANACQSVNCVSARHHSIEALLALVKKLKRKKDEEEYEEEEE